MPSNISHRASGFTLIEALAALMLMAIVLPVAMGAISTATKMASLTERRARATELADILLAEVVLTRAWEDGDAAGVFDETYGDDVEGYEWVLLVDDWHQPEFKQLTLHVVWQTTRGEQDVRLTTVVSAEDGG